MQWASTPEPEPEPEPTKKKQLPIKVKGVKKSRSPLGPDNKVVLVKKITRTRKARPPCSTMPASQIVCSLARSASATSRSARGPSHCPLTGYDRLKVTVKVRATPKKGKEVLEENSLGQDLEGSPLRID